MKQATLLTERLKTIREAKAKPTTVTASADDDAANLFNDMSLHGTHIQTSLSLSLHSIQFNSTDSMCSIGLGADANIDQDDDEAMETNPRDLAREEAEANAACRAEDRLTRMHSHPTNQ